VDGQQQRKALSAAESALRALASGAADRARSAAEKAASLDQLGVYAAFAGWVRRAAGEVEDWGTVLPDTRRGLVDSLGPGPLAAAVEELLG
jgi:hypothetical protein